MARHRDIRNLDFDAERDFDDVYGRSLEEDVAVSPATAAEFLYHRDGNDRATLSSFIERRFPHSAPPPPVAQERKLAGSDISGRTRESSQMSARVVTSHRDQASSGDGPMRLKTRSAKDVKPASPVHITSSSGQPRMGFVTPGSSRSSSPARSPSPSNIKVSTSSATPSVKQPLLVQRSSSKSKVQQVDVVAEYKKRQQTEKTQINLVVIGHVDAGKSTLMGHLLFKLGQVSKRSMHKYQLESEKMGKASFMFAWVLDETGEERNRGITMDIAQHQFETPSLRINLLDAPGHRDFIPNMITGAAQADVSLLVVDATTGEFESGFESGGQTREHAVLIRSLGVTQLLVAVNKMDTVRWQKARFDDIKHKLHSFLKQVGFRESDVTYVPCSGLRGDNLVESSSESELTRWYGGPTLIDCIDKFRPPKRSIEKPFRCCVTDIFKGQGSGVNIAGRIESGHTQTSEATLVMPANELAIVKGVSTGDESDQWAVAGDQVILTLTGVDHSKITIGSVLCAPDQPIGTTTLITARIIVFSIDIPITIGFPILFHFQSMSESGVIRKLVSHLSRSSGEIVRKNPRCLPKNCSAVVEVELSRPVCVELYQEYKELGRFMLRNAGKTIAAGIITKIS